MHKYIRYMPARGVLCESECGTTSPHAEVEHCSSETVKHETERPVVHREGQEVQSVRRAYRKRAGDMRHTVHAQTVRQAQRKAK